MNSHSILHKRNKLLVNIIWGMLVLGIAVDLLTGAGSDSILVLAVVGFITCGVATLLTYRRWLEEYVMYIISAIVTALTLLLIYTGPVITTYLLIYVNLAIMTLYGSFRALAFSTLMGVGVTVYLFASPYKSDVFGDNDIITIFLYLAMIAAPLLASSRFSERLQRDASDQQEKAVEAKNRAEALVADVSASLLLLNDFSSRLKENVEATGGISREVTLAFGEVAASNQTQAASIADIGDSARAIEAAVSSLLERSGEMRAISESSAERTRTGRTDADALEEDMGRLHETTEATVALMRQLGEQSERIGDILATIKRISSQTNILALNAAIEAQRAGEHGKGFAVVSDEVRKLATASQQSTEQIEGILEGIRAKTELAAEQVEGGRRTVVQSRETVRRVSDVLRATAEDSGRIERQSAEVNRSADELQRQYGNIADRIETIAAISEENMASVEEMSASMQTQDDRISEVVDSFLQLDKLASDLNKMTRR